MISSKPLPTIAVLLTCFNRKTKTIQCLQNLFEQKGLNTQFLIESFLVDDGSIDGTSEAVKSTFPSVNVIQGNGNLYWNRGMHLAWQTAENHEYDYYLWLNDDTNIYPYCLTEMLSCADEVNNRSVVCGAVQSSKDGTFTYGGRTKEGKEVVPNNSIQPAYTINGNCVLVPNAVYKEVGMLDPIFPHAIGDFEYGLRALKKGFGIITTKKYVGTCERNASLPKWCYQNVPLRTRIKALYSPLGNAHPYYFFIYENRHLGLLTAIKHFITIHLRALIPSLWK